MSENWIGWHFLPSDGRLRYGDGRAPADGEEVTANGDLILCERGMHASADILDCLEHTTGPILCRVTLNGERIDGNDKSVARSRTILWRINAEDVLRRFTYWCADQAVRVHAVAALRATGHPTDAKHARELAELSEIIDKTTCAAARAAVRSAARDTVMATSVTRDAESSAAWAEERDTSTTACVVVNPTMWAAITAAGWSSTIDATRGVLRTKLLAMIEEARR